MFPTEAFTRPEKKSWNLINPKTFKFLCQMLLAVARLANPELAIFNTLLKFSLYKTLILNSNCTTTTIQ